MKTHPAIKSRLAGIVALLGFCPLVAETYIVKDGRPEAEIVVAAQPARTVKLAAAELQSFVLKISGATLPIVSTPHPAGRVRIYVGRSQYTDELKLTDEGLDHGAFRIASGRNHLVLLGRDRDFTPREPYARSRDDQARALERWDALTGEKWENPVGNKMFQHYNKELNIWVQDERGSLNAVYEFLRLQGVRWYLPDALGEIVPRRSTIELPVVNRTVRPDFALRYPHSNKRFGNAGTPREEILWQLRMGFNNAPDLVGIGEMVHGMGALLRRAEMRSGHADYFCLRGGKRDCEIGAAGRPCLSSEGLFQQNVKFVRAMFDIYDEPMVSVMPVDSYVTLCECDLCKGKGTPERGFHGQISDYVWGYVNRVAQEVYKTHPNKKVSCLAYGGYLLPPNKIDRLSPNVVVGIAQARRDFYDWDKQQQFFIPKQKGWLDNIAEIRSGWLKKLPAGQQQFWNYEYYNLELRPQHSLRSMPVFFPRTVVRDLRSLRGTCRGDFIDMYRDAEGIRDMAMNHLNLYVTARFWWDASQDLDALLEEYYTLYYGPAREEMKTFIEYAEANWMEMGQKPERIGPAFELLGKAQRKVAADSAYGRRIALIADYIGPLKDRRPQPATIRGPASEARPAGSTAPWARVTESEDAIKIETDKVEAVIPKKNPKHWMTGIEKGSFVDKATGFREIGDGLMVVDWLMEPGSDAGYKDMLYKSKPGEDRFGPSGIGAYAWYENEQDPKRRENALLAHGSSYRKRSVEGPQLCHRMKPVRPDIIRGENFIAVRTSYRFEYAAPGRKAGSLWTQVIVFPKGERYFVLMDRVDSVNDCAELFLRNDTPGGIRHNKGDTFSEIFLSYLGGPNGVRIPASEFLTAFPPDLKFGYRRDLNRVPDHFIRAYHLRDKVSGKDGPWLAGITLDASAVYEAWTSARGPGIIVLIEEVHGRPIKAGQSFSTAYVVGFFDTIDEMHAVNERYKGRRLVSVNQSGWRLEK